MPRPRPAINLKPLAAKVEIKPFARNLIAVRNSSGLSQRDFAEEIGIARGSLAAYEVGRYLPGGKTLENIWLKFCRAGDELIPEPTPHRVPEFDSRALIFTALVNDRSRGAKYRTALDAAILVSVVELGRIGLPREEQIELVDRIFWLLGVGNPKVLATTGGRVRVEKSIVYDTFGPALENGIGKGKEQG